MESNRLVIGLFTTFVLLVFIFFITPTVTATLTANQSNPAPATGMLVLVAVWAFPVIMIASIIAYSAYKTIKKT